MKLSLVSIEKDGFIRVAADGNITANDFDASGKNPLEALLGITWFTNRLLLNFDRCGYVDSSAIGWLISCQKAFRDGGGAIVVHSVQPGVKQVLDLLKISRIVPIAEDEAAAKAVLQAHPAERSQSHSRAHSHSKSSKHGGGR